MSICIVRLKQNSWNIPMTAKICDQFLSLLKVRLSSSRMQRNTAAPFYLGSVVRNQPLSVIEPEDNKLNSIEYDPYECWSPVSLSSSEKMRRWVTLGFNEELTSWVQWKTSWVQRSCLVFFFNSHASRQKWRWKTISTRPMWPILSSP